MMPSRMLIRSWLETKTREEILSELAQIKAEHGPDEEQDVRDLLNTEREAFSKSGTLQTPAEKSLMSEHEQWKQKVKADIEFQKQLHRDTKTPD